MGCNARHPPAPTVAFRMSLLTRASSLLTAQPPLERSGGGLTLSCHGVGHSPLNATSVLASRAAYWPASIFKPAAHLPRSGWLQRNLDRADQKPVEHAMAIGNKGIPQVCCGAHGASAWFRGGGDCVNPNRERSSSLGSHSAIRLIDCTTIRGHHGSIRFRLVSRPGQPQADTIAVHVRAAA